MYTHYNNLLIPSLISTAVSVIQKLSDELLSNCFEFTTDKLLTWSKLQLVSKWFQVCVKKPRVLSHFVLKIDRDRLEILGSLGECATGIRKLKLKAWVYKTRAFRVALAPLVALKTLNLSGCSWISDKGLLARAPLVLLAPLVALQTLNLSNCEAVIDEGLQGLAPLVELQELNLTK